MTRIGPFGDIGQARLVDTVSRSANPDETTVAITAIDITVFVNLEKDARMTKRGGAISLATTYGACAVTADAAYVDTDHFGWCDAHACGIRPALRDFNCGLNRGARLVVIDRNGEEAEILPRLLIRRHIQSTANAEIEG